MKNYQKILEASYELMNQNSNILCFGLGVTDEKGVFGTTIGLKKSFGDNRVFDTPTSENAMTGIAVGLAIKGKLPILCHQRFDFALLSIDQIVNSAAKWNFMFGGQFEVPLTIRMIIGRGWGQGPTHSQDFSSWFLNVPGIRVIYLSRPEITKSVFKQVVLNRSPCILIEHRWIHNFESKINLEFNIDDGCEILNRGKDLTIVASSYNTLFIQQCLSFFKKNRLSVELINLVELNNKALEKIVKSVKKTKRLYCIDTSHMRGSVSSYVISHIYSTCFKYLKIKPRIFGRPDEQEPTSFILTKNYYPTLEDLFSKIDLDFKGINLVKKMPFKMKEIIYHDIPGEWFKGPF